MVCGWCVLSSSPVLTPSFSSPPWLSPVELKKQLQIIDVKESTQLLAEQAKFDHQKVDAQIPTTQKHWNNRGKKFIRAKDYNHQQEPGGAMKGK